MFQFSGTCQERGGNWGGETGNPLLFYFSQEASCCDLYDHCGKRGGGLDFPGAFSLFYQHMVVWGGPEQPATYYFLAAKKRGSVILFVILWS